MAHGLAAVLMLTFQLYLTGALHEDGLADTVDGFAGGRTKESRLTIMRDSHIGSFGTLALIISVLLRTYAIVLLGNPKAVLLACITAGAMSRAMISLAMFSLPSARADGMAAWAGKPSDIQVAISIGGACLLTLVCAHTAGLFVIALSFLTCSAICAISRSKIEGVTGDVYGAIQQVIEIVILILATMIVHH